MPITKTEHLEHVLLAFHGDEDGRFKGAQAGYFTVIKDGDTVISRQAGKAQTISELAASGFTWPDVAAAINTASMVTVEQQAAQIAALAAERDSEKTKATEAEARADSEKARADALAAQLATINGAPDENGIPLSVSMSAARIALSRAGKLSTVKAALAAMQGQAGEEAREWFEYSSRIERQHPTVVAMTPLVGTSADVDALFVAAMAIEQSV